MTIQTALSDLESKLGQETHVGEWLTIDQDRIRQFADATDDHQWIHVAEERAASGPFGSTIAHGYLTLALIPFLTDAVNEEKPRYPDIRMGINYGLNRVRFPNAVKVGARVRARTKLDSYEKVAGNGVQIVNVITIEVEGEEKPACVAETVVRLYF